MKYFVASFTVVLLSVAPAWSSAIAPSSQPSISTATTPEQLRQAGQNAFIQGSFTAAATNWQQAANLYRQQGDRLREAILLSNLAIAYRELGQWQEATSAVSTSLAIAKSLQPVTNDVQNAIAQALDTQGNLAFAQGKTEAALQSWQEAQPLQSNDEPAYIRNTINQATAYQRLGLFIRAQQTLEIAEKSLIQQPDSLLKVELLHHFGNILLAIDDPTKAEPYLQQSLQILSKLGNNPAALNLKSGILLDLGHLARTQSEDDEPKLTKAFDLYTEAANTAVYSSDRINAQLSLSEVLIVKQKQAELDRLLVQMQPNIDQLPLSRNGIENRIRYAELLGKQSKREAAAILLAKAIAQSKTLDDRRSQIYALGTLGHLYEQNKQFTEAIDLTNQAIALTLTQANDTQDLAYQWHWQLARLLKATGKEEAALVEYDQAITILKPIQGDIASAATNAQFSFQESIEPLYREYVSLLLETSGTKDKPDQQKLKRAQSVIESLKIAELANFFRNDCLKAQSNDITRIDQTAAVVYIITLNDRLEILLTLPDGNLKRYTTAISTSDLEENISTFQTTLRDASSEDYLGSAKSIYNWTIRPLETDLANSKVQTLVIVADQTLRNIPFAALHDGKQFLVEKYNLASSPGLQLLDSKPIAKKQVNVLLLGLTESRFGFSTLPSVRSELDTIQNRVGNSKENLFVNETFTSQGLQNSMQSFSFPIVHIATHGNFSSKASETFIVAWDRKINIEQLNSILKSRDRSDTEPLELLILSACQTAIGDKRSALGLAGIAVRAGARSTIGSLWQVSDSGTSLLMSALYNKLADRNVSRAEALRSAQLTLLKNAEFNHPYYWSPFILLGNWQ